MSTRRARLESFDYRGRYWYFVTCYVEDRRDAFDTPERISCVHAEILPTSTQRAFAVPAGVFMTDHVHLLLQGLTDTSDFTRCMTLIRQRTAFAFSKRFGERLWQKRYYERVLRNPDEAPSVVAYIADNPRQAGLVSADEEYAYVWTPTYIGAGVKAETYVAPGL